MRRFKVVARLGAHTVCVLPLFQLYESDHHVISDSTSNTPSPLVCSSGGNPIDFQIPRFRTSLLLPKPEFNGSRQSPKSKRKTHKDVREDARSMVASFLDSIESIGSTWKQRLRIGRSKESKDGSSNRISGQRRHKTPLPAFPPNQNEQKSEFFPHTKSMLTLSESVKPTATVLNKRDTGESLFIRHSAGRPGYLRASLDGMRRASNNLSFAEKCARRAYSNPRLSFQPSLDPDDDVNQPGEETINTPIQVFDLHPTNTKRSRSLSEHERPTERFGLFTGPLSRAASVTSRSSSAFTSRSLSSAFSMSSLLSPFGSANRGRGTFIKARSVSPCKSSTRRNVSNDSLFDCSITPLLSRRVSLPVGIKIPRVAYEESF